MIEINPFDRRRHRLSQWPLAPVIERLQALKRASSDRRTFAIRPTAMSE